jgi:hypothetical protein
MQILFWRKTFVDEHCPSPGPHLRTPNPGFNPEFTPHICYINPGLNPGFGVLRSGLRAPAAQYLEFLITPGALINFLYKTNAKISFL